MKATSFQVIFAEDWLAKVWIGSFVIATISVTLAHLLPTFRVLGFSFNSVLLACVVLIGGVIAYFVSIVLGSCILPPIYRMRERINGAPFESGDLVEILKKPYRGSRARIVSAGDPTYGAFLSVERCAGGAPSINLPWHSIRRIHEPASNSSTQDHSAPDANAKPPETGF